LLVSTLKEVMLAAGDCSRGVAVSLRPRSMELSASAPEAGTANAKLPARFIGGGDCMIHTGFNPDFLMDAVKSIPGERIVLDVGQNGYGANNAVSGKPIILHGQEDLHVRWVVMPVNTGYPKPLHTLRKSCITDWASRHPGHVVKQWAGHSDMDTTEQYYLQVSEAEYEQAAATPMSAVGKRPANHVSGKQAGGTLVAG
jgi:hypothetical protein